LTLMLEGKIITFCHLDQVVNNAWVWILHKLWSNVVLQ
jgi:hypothetical protein